MVSLPQQPNTRRENHEEQNGRETRINHRRHVNRGGGHSQENPLRSVLRLSRNKAPQGIPIPEYQSWHQLSTARLCEIQQKHQKGTIIIGMEPTGHYWENLANEMKGHGIMVVLVSSLHVHQSKEMDDNSPAKTDAKDAGVIASLVKDGRFSIPNMPEGIYAEIRNLIRFRDQVVQEQIRYKLRLQMLLDRYFPERASVFKDVAGKASLAVLKQFPFPEDINNSFQEQLIAVMSDATHKKVGKSKAIELINVAQNSIGIKEGLYSARFQITSLVGMLEHLMAEKSQVEDKIKGMLEQISYAKSLLTIPGICFR